MEMKKIALAGAVALLAGTANAEPLTWTEVGAGFNVADAGEDSIDAFDIRGGIGFAGIGHAQASYLDGSADNFYLAEGGDVDFDGFEVRAGVHPSVGDKTQVIAEAIYFDYSGDVDGSSFDVSDGWGLGFGVRHQFGDQFEVRAQIDYFDGEAFGDVEELSSDFNDTNYSFGGRYYWMPNLFTGVSVHVNGMGGIPFTGDTIRLDVGWSLGGDAF
jgi:hypothetical protein